MFALLLLSILIPNTRVNPDNMIQPRYVKNSSGYYIDQYYSDEMLSIFTGLIVAKKSDNTFEYFYAFFDKDNSVWDIEDKVLQAKNDLPWWRQNKKLYRIYIFVNQQGYIYILPLFEE